MQTKFGWYLSAVVLTVVLWFAGMLGMMSASLGQLFGGPDRVFAVSHGATWIVIGAFMLMTVFLLVSCAGEYAERQGISRVFTDLIMQCGAIMFGAFFVRIITVYPGLLVLWLLILAIMYAILVDARWHEGHDWAWWTLYAQIVTTAATLLCLAAP